MIPTPYDSEIADLERKLRELRRKQRAARSGKAPAKMWAKRTVRKAKRPADVEAYWNMLRTEIGCIAFHNRQDPDVGAIGKGCDA